MQLLPHLFLLKLAQHLLDIIYNVNLDIDGSIILSGIGYDFLSNGFKVRTSNAGNNRSGGTYIYMTFAEHPFVSSEGVPVTAK